MIFYDPIYGRFSVPADLGTLIFTPEVRRLSQIRLFNTLSPTMTTLGEIRRYSHTIGVLHLCEKNKSPGFTEEERKALAASVLLHDIGTPPFGHLLEYHLQEQFGWSHENIIRDVLWGFHAPENRAHQIFGGRAIEFQAALKKVGLRFDLVEAIVTRQHPLSLLLFGSMDLDNLDNVARMGWALGFSSGKALAVRLATALSVTRGGHLGLSKATHESSVKEWLRLRRSVYDLIVFDPMTVAAQAVLSEAIGVSMSAGLIREEDWNLSDEELLDFLRRSEPTKDLITREYLGRLPSMAFCVQVQGAPATLASADRGRAKSTIEKALKVAFPNERVLGYAFVDNGTFEKSLKFVDVETNETWKEGKASNSTVYYGFVRSPKNLPFVRCKNAMDYFLELRSVAKDSVSRFQIGEGFVDADADQQSLNLPSA